jgi:peptide/nickel transport system substrate-binding protein
LNKKYAYNVSKAKSLLAAAGYAKGFTLKMPSGDPTEAQLYPVIQQDLAAVGIKVQYVSVAANQVTNEGLSGDYSAFLSYTNPTDNWADATSLLSPKGDLNPFHTDDPKVTSLLNQIKVANPVQQAKLYKQLNTYIVDQAWFAPSEFSYVILAYNAKVMKVDLPAHALSTPVYAFQPAN